MLCTLGKYEVMFVPKNYSDMVHIKQSKRYLFEMTGTITSEKQAVSVSLYDKQENYYPISEEFSVSADIEEKFRNMQNAMQFKPEDGYSLLMHEHFTKKGLEFEIIARKDGETYATAHSLITWKQLFKNHISDSAEYLRPKTYPKNMLKMPVH